MPKLSQIGKAQQFVATHPQGLVLVSYETPVAAIISGQCLRTSERYSVTTTRHINSWLPDWCCTETVPQEKIDALFNECV